MDWLLITAALMAAGVLGGKSIAGRATVAKVSAEHGPLVDRGRIEGFAAVLLRTGQTITEQSGDSVLRVHELAVLLGPYVYPFAAMRRVNAAGNEFEVDQAEGLVRVRIDYPRQASRTNEAFVRAARAQGVRVGEPKGRSQFEER